MMLKGTAGILPKLFLILLIPVLSLAEEESTPYPLQAIDPDSDKFDRIFQEVAGQLYQAEKDAIKTYDVTILQTISPGRYRVRVGQTVYAAEIPGKPIADDEVVRLPLVETDEVYQYTTVLGANSTIKVAKIVDDPERLTRSQFILLLQAGKHFPIQMGTFKEKCSNCGGFGMISSVSKIQCRVCSGRGGWVRPKMFDVHW
jgi:hypothetical protein